MGDGAEGVMFTFGVNENLRAAVAGRQVKETLLERDSVGNRNSE